MCARSRADPRRSQRFARLSGRPRTYSAAVVKRCGRCGIDKPIDAFHRRGARTQAWCKPCRRAYDAAYHRSTRERRITQAKARSAQFRAWYVKLKEGRPCADCGGVFHPVAMQWDHRPGSGKRADVANLRSSHSRRLVLEEIAKCDLVCANCHAVRTFLRTRGVAQPG